MIKEGLLMRTQTSGTMLKLRYESEEGFSLDTSCRYVRQKQLKCRP